MTQSSTSNYGDRERNNDYKSGRAQPQKRACTAMGTSADWNLPVPALNFFSCSHLGFPASPLTPRAKLPLCKCLHFSTV